MSGDLRPRVIVFDVNETLIDLAPLGSRLEAVGVSPRLLPVWFASVLRDGIALTLAGGPAAFSAVAADALRSLLAGRPDGPDPEQAVEHVLGGLPELPVHPDVPTGVRALRRAGHRLFTLTNGSADTTRAVLHGAGLEDCFEAHLDIEGAEGRWKPAAEAYAHAVRTAGADASEVMLVSAHPWDVDGAGRAGLATAWLRRAEAPYPSCARPADRQATGMADLARQLGGTEAR